MLPAALYAGISYSDFWQMTLGEIKTFFKYAYKMEREKSDNEQRIAAFTAYYSGVYSQYKPPRTLTRAFPSLFGRTSDGNIKAENWRESQKALQQIAKNFNKGVK